MEKKFTEKNSSYGMMASKIIAELVTNRRRMI